MFFIISKILAFLIKPTFWILGLLIFSIFKKNKRKYYIIIITLLYIFFTNEFIYNEAARCWEEPSKDVKILDEKYDIGIVLGGFSDFDSITQKHNFKKEADRFIYTFQLYNRGIIKKILISGGNGRLSKSNFKEAETIQKFLINNSVNKKDIIIESESRNTKENAFYSAQIIKEDSKVILITSATHMKRALLCFKRAGVQVTAFPVDNMLSYRSINPSHILLPKARVLEYWEELIHEIIGYLVYYIYL